MKQAIGITVIILWLFVLGSASAAYPQDRSANYFLCFLVFIDCIVGLVILIHPNAIIRAPKPEQTDECHTCTHHDSGGCQYYSSQDGMPAVTHAMCCSKYEKNTRAGV